MPLENACRSKYLTQSIFPIKGIFPEIRNVKDFELQYATVKRIWQFARDRNFALITFDADFNDLAILHGIPRKIIWLRFGNTLIQNLVEKK